MAYLPTPFTAWPQMGQAMMPAQAQPQQQGLIWVDGEVGAKAYQLPAGWPANTPLALWDTNDTVIYLKSTNQMGMPNPLQIAHYQLEERYPKHSWAAGREDYTEQTWGEEAYNKMQMEMKELRDEIASLKRSEKE